MFESNALPNRFWNKVNPEPGGCWIWTAGKFDGYGMYWHNSKVMGAHRVCYLELIGPIPEGMELDHLCRVRSCVNPSHLEVVSKRENILRGEGKGAKQARQVECKNGHKLDGENLLIEGNRRRCRVCTRARQRRRYAKMKGLLILLAMLTGCRAWFDSEEPTPSYHPNQVDDSIFKLKHQDVMWLDVRGDVAEHYDVKIKNLLQEDWDANVLNVWWSSMACPYKENPTNAIMLDNNRCVAGVMYACNEIYVATNYGDPTDACPTATAHEYGHCVRMLLGWDPDGGHKDDEFWGIVEAARKDTCAEYEKPQLMLETTEEILEEQCEHGRLDVSRL